MAIVQCTHRRNQNHGALRFRAIFTRGCQRLRDFHRSRRDRALAGCRTRKSASNFSSLSARETSFLNHGLSIKWEFDFKSDRLLGRRRRGACRRRSCFPGTCRRRSRCLRRSCGRRSRRSRGIQQLLLNPGSPALSLRIRNGEHEGDRKECHAQPNGELGQHMSRLSTKYVLCHGASKRGPKSFAAGKLHQNDQHQKQTDDHMKSQQDGDDEPHIGKSRKLLHRVSFVKVLPAESLDPPRAS